MSVPISAGKSPPVLRILMNTTAEAAAVAPNANDMMLPLIVMKVIPAARQPITDAVVRSAVRLGAERKLGVARAHTSRAPMMMARMVAMGFCARIPRWRCARAEGPVTGSVALTTPTGSGRQDE